MTLAAFVLPLFAQQPVSGWKAGKSQEGTTAYTPESPRPGEDVFVVAGAPMGIDRSDLKAWFRRRVDRIGGEAMVGARDGEAPGTLLRGGTVGTVQRLFVLRYAGDRGRIFVYQAKDNAALTRNMKSAVRLMTELSRDLDDGTTSPPPPEPEPDRPRRPVPRDDKPLPGVPAQPGKPLPPASLNGAKVYVKYEFGHDGTGMSFDFEELILFPDGSAFQDVPSGGVASFTPVNLRKGTREYDKGTWRRQGNSAIVLTMNGKSRTIRKVAKGWQDRKGNYEGAYDIYFPVRPLTKAQLLGAWRSKSLYTSGMMGGGTASVASGSTTDFMVKADGTYTGRRDSFASATTANMGDAFKSGGDVTTYSKNNRPGAGRWRLDGVLLTRETGGRRVVELAYVLPNFSKSGELALLIGGAHYERPGK